MKKKKDTTDQSLFMARELGVCKDIETDGYETGFGSYLWIFIYARLP